MRTRSFHLEIFLVALAIILLEISYTRVFSFKLFYYFTYLIIGVALLGLGSGGVFFTVLKPLRRMDPAKLVSICCLLAALAVPASYAAVAFVQLETGALGRSPVELAKLTLICGALFAPFLLAGVSLTTILATRAEEIPRLYFADLLGAGLGCALCVPLMLLLTPPGCVLASGLVLAVAGVRPGLLAWRMGLPVHVGAAVLIGALLAFGSIPDPVPDPVKTQSPQLHKDARVVYSRWSPVFRVDLVDRAPDGEAPTRYYLNHDGMLGSSVLRFDGDLASAGAFDQDARSIPFSVLDPAPEVMIIGSAGGHEILVSLYFGAEHVTAVELNPVTVSILRDHYADFSGGIANHPRVSLVNGEGRTFVARDENRYDLIWFVAPDSYSAMNAASSGAFVLSESYLYTTEMIALAMEHLAKDGILCVQFGEIEFEGKPNRTVRYLATARAALAELGIDDFPAHVMLATSPEFFTMATILLKRTPFSPEEQQRFRSSVALLPEGRLWQPPVDSTNARGRHPVLEVIAKPDSELGPWFDAYPYLVEPVTDDSPFFWHFARFGDALLREWGGDAAVAWDPEDATGERVLMTLLAFSAVFASIFLLLPFVFVRDVFARLPYKANAALYFSALGLGFMFYEVSLIQKLTLFLGYPTYSLTVTLFALLVFTGLGSLLTGRYSGRRRMALFALLGALFALALFYTLGLSSVVDAFIGATFAARVAVAVAMLAPLGLCLGAFMPLGLGTVSALGESPEQYVAWCWAINGFFSVMSSILATLLSMSLGFQAVLFIALLVYACGVLALSRIPETAAEGRAAR